MDVRVASSVYAWISLILIDRLDFTSQGSSAVHSFIQGNVPMLATRRITDAYKYIDHDEIVIRRPQGVREMDAVRALRTGASRLARLRRNILK